MIRLLAILGGLVLALIGAILWTVYCLDRWIAEKCKHGLYLWRKVRLNFSNWLNEGEP